MTHKEAVNDLNTIKEFFEQESGAYPISLDYAIKVLKSEPSADRPQGKWIDVWQDGICSWRGTCSVCRSTNDIPPPFEANFCPSCGARMKGADDEQMD